MAKSEGTKSKRDKLPESRQKRANKRLISNLLIWILVCGLLSLLFFWLEDITAPWTYHRGLSPKPSWAAEPSIFVIILGFNLATTDVLRHYVRQHGRNVVSWTTSSLLFTPILTGVVYLLTWPKNKKLTGLE